MWKSVRKAADAATHVCAVVLVLVLPFGYENPDDSTNVIVGLQGGGGNVVAVLRDCSGDAVASDDARFIEGSAGASMRVHQSEQTSIIAGIRAGYWEISDGGWPVRHWEPDWGPIPRFNLSDRWAAVQLSAESEKYGIGAGYIFGGVPSSYSDMVEDGADLSRIWFSGHLRLGSWDANHFLVSLAEGDPMLSSGLIQVGLGGRVSRRIHLFIGIAGGWYDGSSGVLASTIGLNEHVNLKLAVRPGTADGHFEGGGSAGLQYGFTLR